MVNLIFWNGPTGIMESFLQNLLGNAIQFNNIYNQIIAAQKSNNTMQVYYQIGRILYLLIDFDPIEDSSLRSSLKDEAISYYTAVAQMLEERELLQEEEIKLRKLFQSDYERIILQQESIQTVYDKAYSFGFQFLNQSIGTSSPNSSICTGNITVLQNALNLIQVQIKLQYFDQMGQTIKQLLQTTGPLTYGCYYSLFEYFQIVQDYFGTIGDLDKLFYNIVHHMGNVYDNTIAMVELFRFGDPTILSYWKNLGYYFGNSLNQICYKPANYDPYRPTSR